MWLRNQSQISICETGIIQMVFCFSPSRLRSLEGTQLVDGLACMFQNGFTGLSLTFVLIPKAASGGCFGGVVRGPGSDGIADQSVYMSSLQASRLRVCWLLT